MKKTVTTLLVVATVFLCTNYYVKADEVIDSTRRYNWLSTTQHYGNVDITGNLFCLSDNPAMQSVDLSSVAYVQNGSTGTVLSTWESCYVWKFQATYVIRNNSDNFEVFDNARFYSNWQFTAKASSNSGPSGGLTDEMVPSGWYIDNIQGATLTNALADGTLYFSIDDLYYGTSIILAPGEVRTFSYDINVAWWEQSFGVGGVSASAQNGSISNTMGYTQDGGYHSYTVQQFINTGMITNNALAFYQQILQQGDVDATLLNDIVDLLTYGGNITNPIDNSPAFTTFVTQSINSVRLFGRRLIGNRKLIDSTVVIDPSNDTQYTLYSYEIPVMISIYVDNLRNYNVRNNGANGYISLNFGGNNYTIEQFSSTLFSGIQFLSQNTINLYGKYLAYDVANNPLVIPKGRYTTFIVVKYHYQTTDPNYNYVIPNYIIDNFPTDFIEYNSLDFDYNDTTVFTKIKMKLQQILDAYNANQPAADDVTDASDDMSDQADTQHQQEVAYFGQNDTAMDNSGLGTFTFNNDQVSAIGTSATMFTNIWNMLGPWSAFIIFILTLRLATLILRHKPKSES